MVVQWNVILLIIKSRPAIYYIQIVYNKKLLLQHPKINASGITYDEIDKATLRLNVFYETHVSLRIFELRLLIKLFLSIRLMSFFRSNLQIFYFLPKLTLSSFYILTLIQKNK